MPTPHIEAKENEIAKIVIMPGDPKRVEYIKNNFLENAKLVNEIRGEIAYTGIYKGKEVTVFSSGMGIPSMGIYSYELFTNYNVDIIIRVGSAGSYTENLKLKDLFLVTSTYSESNYDNYSDKIVYSNKELNEIIEKTAQELNIKLETGRCHSTETFYNKNLDINEITNNLDCKCVEMETYSLFLNAHKLGKKATSLLTISDSLITKEELTSTERATTFDEMITLALETATKL